MTTIAADPTQYDYPIGPRRATILDEINAFLDRFISFPDTRQRDVCAMWVLHTHAFDFAAATPYLYITSAEKQSGKTRVIEVLSSLARHATVTASVSSAAMYRLISEDRPTLFIDEVDTVFTGASNEDLRNVLNSGYKSNGTALRFTGKETEAFSTFCPKLLAGIDNAAMPDTIADRCIRIVLKRKRAGDEIERWNWRRVEQDVSRLLDLIDAWKRESRDALNRIAGSVDYWDDDMSDRGFEIAEPLVEIADVIGFGWQGRARDALSFLLRGEVKALSPQAQALKAAQDWFAENDTDRIPSSVLCDLLGVNGKRLGVLLAPYEITPTTARVAQKPTKCYYRASFVDAWERYL